MNNLYFSFIALTIIGIFLLVFGFYHTNNACIIIAFLVLVLAFIRYMVAKKFAKLDINYETIQDDMIGKKLKAHHGKYAMMYNLYKSDYCELLYGENDGVLLYDNKNDIYLVSVDSANACLDIISKMKYATNKLLLFDESFVDYFKHEYAKVSEKEYYINEESNKYWVDEQFDLANIEQKNRVSYDVLKGISFDNDYQRKLLFAIKNNELIDNKLYAYTIDSYIGEELKLTKHSIKVFTN